MEHIKLHLFSSKIQFSSGAWFLLNKMIYKITCKLEDCSYTKRPGALDRLAYWLKHHIVYEQLYFRMHVVWFHLLKHQNIECEEFWINIFMNNKLQIDLKKKKKIFLKL